MKLIKWIVIAGFILPAQAEAEECVVLLHGLARSNHSLSTIESTLHDAGYHTVNQNYPSTKHNIEKLAKEAITEALGKCPLESKIHFVTHSLGGILVRQYLTAYTIDHLGRIVMLGPPNKGSQVVDKLKNFPGFKLINGPAGMQLGTGELSVPNQLGPANFEVGIIAGARSINLILSTMLPDQDDGKVTLENTKLEGMSDHIALPVIHTFMMKNSNVIDQIIHFLKHGVFDREETKQS
ncbi:MAG: alpha/beta hydrolase [Chromatiales bacterium]|nr:alpha/beta hydrolase [Chromatiales bacterium]